MRLTKADKWLIGGLLAAAAGGIGVNLALLRRRRPGGAGLQRGQTHRDYPAAAGYREELRAGRRGSAINLIVADNGRVEGGGGRLPGPGLCAHRWAQAAPQQIVCLPYRVVIKVVSTAPAEVDDITK
jgi:hypothetical protein